MALTPRRWIAALATTLFALVAVLVPAGAARGFIRYLPWAWYYGFVPNGSRVAPPDSLHNLYNRLSQELSVASEQVVLASWRDSVLRQTAMIDRARRGGPQLYVARVADQADPAMLLRIQATLDSAWRSLPRRNPRAWTVVLLAPTNNSIPLSDSLEAYLGLSSGVEPLMHGSPLDGDGCVLLIDATVTALPVAPQLLLDKLAPCWWRAAFGPPSDSINTWLQRQSWVSTYPIRWWLRGWNEVQMMSGRRGARVVADTGAWGDSTRVAVDWALSWGAITAASCYQGDQDACLRVFRAPDRWGRRVDLSPSEEMIPTISRRRVAGGVLLAGLLQAVLDSVGPDRFHSFWTSQQSPDTALARAIEGPVGPWLSSRVERRLGRVSPRSGIRLGSAGVALLIAGVLAAIGLLTATRRLAG